MSNLTNAELKIILEKAMNESYAIHYAECMNSVPRRIMHPRHSFEVGFNAAIYTIGTLFVEAGTKEAAENLERIKDSWTTHT